MNRLSITAGAAVLLLALLSGCPGTPQPADSPPDTSLAAQDEICETLPPIDTAVTAAVDSAPAEPEPEPEPAPERPPESPPKPRVLPRMWDFGSTNCLPCKTMKEILDPMMTEYKGKVDIRIINVYEDKERTQQFRIVTIPTQVFIDPAGNELFRHIGVYPRDSLVTRFREYGWE